MGNLEKQWKNIQAVEPAEKRSAFIKYCLLCVAAKEAESLNEEEAAFKICGIGGQIVSQLLESDRAIIDLACDLELPPAQRSHKDTEWSQLAEMILQAGAKTE